MSKIVNYATAYEFLNSLYSYEADAKRISAPEFHLKNIEALLEKLGNPHKKYASFHIAGTKGKGSVAAMLTAIAIANNPIEMARAFALSVQAGRMAYEAGLGKISNSAEASSPLTSFLDL